MYPFIEKEFTNTWMQYFAQQKKAHFFESISPLGFIKSRIPFLYYNIGKNITNGLYYELNSEAKDYKNKVFLMYDIIRYAGIPHSDMDNKDFGIKNIDQYKGYLTRLTDYADYEAFVNDHYSRSTRMKLRKNLRKLETNFPIEYEELYGPVDENKYHKVMDRLYYLIENRFDDLGVDNDILHKRDYYRVLFLKMVQEKKAIIHLIKHGDRPISICLSFLTKDVMFFAINTFDTNYRRYNLGHLSIINLMKWCFNNDIQVLDYSKGTYEYKLRWRNEEYCFENHIVYDKHSIGSTIVANVLYYYYRFKQYLRDLKINETYVKLRYRLFHLNRKPKEVKRFAFEKMSDAQIDKQYYKELEQNSEAFQAMQATINDLIYSKPQPVKEVTLMKHQEKEEYLVLGKDLQTKVMVDSQ
ncbi:MAG: GNAT family N-acetyltransferase [Flavobacteriaceae bacterium]|nr:GNAT family N-acetyltransferase [Flavobacteriaceae bacterium]